VLDDDAAFKHRELFIYFVKGSDVQILWGLTLLFTVRDELA
jgi:hypothetical protein